MAVRKKAEVVEPFDYEEAYRQLCQQMHGLHIMRIDEMPRIELYLDQLISIVSMELAPLYEPQDKIVTGSMVNNYVKQHVLPAPTRKRYTSTHLASLMFVCCFKRVLTMAQVASLLAMYRAADIDTDLAYDEIACVLERALAKRFPADAENSAGQMQVDTHVQLTTRSGEPVTGELPAIMESTIGLVVNQIFVEKILALEERKAQSAGAQEQL